MKNFKSLRHKFSRFFSIKLWGSLPGWLQRELSGLYAGIYNKSFSKYFIKPYCWINYSDPDYLDKFRPASGGNSYKNFQDFFIRVFKEPLTIKSDAVWACEGLLCDYGKVKEMSTVSVKCQEKSPRSIFGNAAEIIPGDHYFSNIFLHNNNYHRIHAPINGTVSRIEHIPGDLVILRPWIYDKDPSLPAFRNERVNIDITNRKGETWFLSIVGGPAVGTIVLAEFIELGSMVNIGQEIATFLLGSTCCIASPIPINAQVGQTVEVGLPF